MIRIIVCILCFIFIVGWIVACIVFKVSNKDEKDYVHEKEDFFSFFTEPMGYSFLIVTVLLALSIVLVVWRLKVM